MKVIEENEKEASRRERWIILGVSLVFGDLVNKLFLRLTSIDSFVLSMYVFESGYYYFRNDIQKMIKKVRG